MEYSTKLKSYPAAPSSESIAAMIASAQEHAASLSGREPYITCLSCLDLTTLSCRDTDSSVREFARRALSLYSDFPHLEGVASICVFPPFVESVGIEIDGSPLRITSVAGGFPASQSFLEVKALEVAMAIENGADEIDVVINVGKILEGDYDEAAGEIELLSQEVGEDVTLKVIIESGELGSAELIYDATLLSLLAGASFVKSSTGKVATAATPEAIAVMATAIKAHFSLTGERVGIKVAGGVRTAADAALYYSLIETILGKEWLTPELFRIGASSLANSLLSAIEGRDIELF